MLGAGAGKASCGTVAEEEAGDGPESVVDDEPPRDLFCREE